MIFPSCDDSTKVVEPTDGSFDDPTMGIASELATILKRMPVSAFAVRTNQINTAREQLVAKPVRVGGFVIDQPLQFRFADELPAKQTFDQNDFISVGRLDVQTERNSVAVNQKHDLGSFSATGRTNAIAPFFADENVPSPMHSDHSISPSESIFLSNRLHAFSNRPDSVHCLNRRWHVDLDGKQLGKSFHRAPVISTHRIASKQARGSHRGRPPRFDGGFQGNRSLIKPHCLSVNCHSCVSGSVLDPALLDRNGRTRDRSDMSVYSFQHP